MIENACPTAWRLIVHTPFHWLVWTEPGSPPGQRWKKWLEAARYSLADCRLTTSHLSHAWSTFGHKPWEGISVVQDFPCLAGRPQAMPPAFTSSSHSAWSWPDVCSLFFHIVYKRPADQAYGKRGRGKGTPDTCYHRNRIG